MDSEPTFTLPDPQARQRALRNVRVIGTWLHVGGLTSLVLLATLGSMRARVYWRDQWWTAGNQNDAWAILYFLMTASVGISIAGLLSCSAGEAPRMRLRFMATIALVIGAVIWTVVARVTLTVPSSG